MSNKESDDRAQPYSNLRSLDTFHHLYQKCHECTINKSVAHIAIHHNGFKVEQSINLLLSWIILGYRLIKVIQVSFNLWSFNSLKDLFRRPRRKTQIVRVIRYLHLLLYLFISNDRFHCLIWIMCEQLVKGSLRSLGESILLLRGLGIHIIWSLLQVCLNYRHILLDLWCSNWELWISCSITWEIILLLSLQDLLLLLLLLLK